MRLTYYPGCSLKTSSKFYDASIKEVFSYYGIELKELDDWSCCGASAAHCVDEELAHALVARNLAIAEKEGNHFFAPCSACYSRSRATNEKMREDHLLRDRINKVIAPGSCIGAIEVKNIIEVLRDDVTVEKIAHSLLYDLSGIKVVPYYGCVLTRMMRIKPFDDKEDPKSMDALLWAAGLELVDWPFKMECCGASKTLTNKEMTLRLSSRIMECARDLGADAIVTPCPLCQMNLDLLPYLGRQSANLPVLFLSEVFELALFGRLSGSGSHFIPTADLTKKVVKLSPAEQGQKEAS